MITCILLAAGLSSRFGSPKALADIQGTLLINGLQETLVKSKVSHIVIVLGANADLIKPHLLNHTKVSSVYNKDYKMGQTSSFQAGLRAISSGTTGVMLMPVDFPFIKGQTIDILVEQFLEKPSKILIPSYGGRKGHPPVFHAELRKPILEMESALGLNVFERQHSESTRIAEVDDPGILKTFNTPEELKKILEEV